MSIKDTETADPELDTLVQIEKLELLFQLSFPAIFISIVTAILLTAILWPVQDHAVLLFWLAILATTAIGRLMLFMSYRKISPQGRDVLRWERPYLVTLMLSSLVWGAGSVIIMPSASPVHQVTILYFMIGMAGGAISVYSAHRLMALLTVAIVLLPATAWMLFQGDLLSMGVVIGAVIFFLSAQRATKVLALALDKSFRLSHELHHAKEFAERTARVDALTDLYNRRAFYEQASSLVNYCQHNEDEFSLILVDIDHFKSINDSHGHAAGDQVLKYVAAIFRKDIRHSDYTARIGGEEFAILLLSISPEQATVIAEMIRQKISAVAVPFNDTSIAITASFGVAGREHDIDQLLRKADSALYRAKEAGRNRVECDGCIDQEGKLSSIA